MKKNLQYILVFLVLVIAIAGYYGYSEYNRPHKDTKGLTVQEKMAATALIAAYENDENTANTKYLNKVIQVTGAIISAEADKDGVITVYLGDGASMASVSCALEKNKNYTVETFKKGNNVVITGLCNGYLTDVIMNRCIVN
jgi:uncharacterized protein YpmB